MLCRQPDRISLDAAEAERTAGMLEISIKCKKTNTPAEYRGAALALRLLTSYDIAHVDDFIALLDRQLNTPTTYDIEE